MERPDFWSDKEPIYVDIVGPLRIERTAAGVPCAIFDVRFDDGTIRPYEARYPTDSVVRNHRIGERICIGYRQTVERYV